MKTKNIFVEIDSMGSNSIEILGTCERAARDAGVDEQEISGFLTSAMSGNRDHLLATVMENFTLV